MLRLHERLSESLYQNKDRSNEKLSVKIVMLVTLVACVATGQQEQGQGVGREKEEKTGKKKENSNEIKKAKEKGVFCSRNVSEAPARRWLAVTAWPGGGSAPAPPAGLLPQPGLAPAHVQLCGGGGQGEQEQEQEQEQE